jgi:MFS transporter, PAT family, beta-lactamase induction signal transducer AmpG
MPTERSAPHPAIWMLLYLPFGAVSGFFTVALTHTATDQGLSISEGALITGSTLLSQWMKWLWAPAVDVTLTPKRWYVIGTSASALGVLLTAAIPLREEYLGGLLALIAVVSLLNSIVGMAIEAIMAKVTPPSEQGRVSGWFQAGNLGGAALAGGAGLTMLLHLPAPWMAGAVLATVFLACNALLVFVPDVESDHSHGPLQGVVGVARDMWEMVRTKGGLLSAIICFMPLGTGAASSVLAQSKVASAWGASGDDVALVQGYLSVGVTAVGAFLGGWLCDRVRPRTAYVAIGAGLAGVAAAMALSPATRLMYLTWSLAYQLGVGMAYAAFTAVVLSAIGTKSGATKYSSFASLSNFPIWWLGLALGAVADRFDAPTMLLAEAAFAVVAIGIFTLSTAAVSRTRLPDTLEA